MAIKVGGTTVIDDSRAVSNVTTLTATTVNANVTATGTITAATFSGSGTGLTGVASVGKAIAIASIFGG